MNKPISLCFFLFFLVFYDLSLAQKGDLYLYNYDVPIKNLDNQNSAVVQGNNGFMYFANKKGVMSYDGVSWELIRTSNTPYALVVDPRRGGKVYVGCRESFGYLKRDKKGQDNYVTISGDYKNFGEIQHIKILDKFIYFYSDKALFKASLASNQVIKVWRANPDREFAGLAFHQDKIYINIQGKGLHQVQEKGFRLVKETKEAFADHYLRASVRYNSSQSLLCMSDDQCYYFNGRSIKPYKPFAENYIEGNVIRTALNLNDQLLAIATLSGGVIVIDKKTLDTEAILNYQTGLPDDEVSAICTDNQGGIWISHAKGISRADLKLPIRLFSGYAGLEGNLETVFTHGDSLFVATSDGLYYLSKVDRYEEIASLIRKEQKYLRTVENVVKTIRIEEPFPEKTVRIYRHSQNGEKKERRKIIIEEEKEIKKIPTRVFGTEFATTLFRTKEARKAYALQSIPYIYKEVKGLNAKCRQLLSYRGSVIAASNLGLYEVVQKGEEIEANPIIPDKYINFIYQSEQNPSWLYVCTESGLIILTKDQYTWREVANQEDALNTNVYSLMEDGNTLWLGAESQVFKLKIGQEGELSAPKRYLFKESYSEDVLVRMLKGNPAFILSSGIYSYNPKKDDLFKNPKLQKYFNPRSHIFYQQAGFTWIKNSSWQNISHPEDTDFLKTTYFEFFGNIEEIYVDPKQNIWIIDNNSLFRISSEAQKDKQENFTAYIKHIQNKPDEFIPLDQVIFDYNKEGRSFTFRMAAPFYRNESAVEYQYWLEGLSKDWSDWNTEAAISFPYVPSGDYKLHVRARNMFNQRSEEQIYAFRIRPPFWETYWFYGLQISVMLGLLILSFVFSRSGKNATVAYILTFVSLITIFEFVILLLEPYVENFSNGIPIFKLGMNILLAISLNPLERYVKTWLKEPKAGRTGSEAPHETEARAMRESS